LYPDGVEDKTFRGRLSENGVIVAGGLGEVAGKVFRIGHMGNLSLAQIYFALQAVENTLSSLNYSFEPQAAVNAAKAILGED